MIGQGPASTGPRAAAPEDLERAIAALAAGAIVAYPTESSYGLAVDALDSRALDRLAACKGRGEDKAFSVLVSGTEMLATLCTEVPPRALALARAHWPGPLTIALAARADLPPAIVLGGCVAVRRSPHPAAQALVMGFGRPITATSANPAGRPPACTAAEVHAYFGAACVVLDAGAAPGGPPSTLARVRGDSVEILRAGPVQIAG